MSTAAEIVKLIQDMKQPMMQTREVVERANEIDLLVARYLISGPSVIRNIVAKGQYIDTDYRQVNHDHGWSTVEKREFAKVKFSSSRDALRSIRPVGWDFTIDIPSDPFEVYVTASKSLGNKLAGHEKKIEVTGIGDECLAELSAIIQVIEYERVR